MMKIMFREVLPYGSMDNEYEEITLEELEEIRNNGSNNEFVELEEIDFEANTMYFRLTCY